VSGGTAAVGIYAADVYAAPTDTLDITQRLPAAKQHMSGMLKLQSLLPA